MTTEHRRAPRREIVEINRIGAWGQVKYQHKLSCGHIESRPRAATSPTLACAWCLRVDERKNEFTAIAALPEAKLITEDEEESFNQFEVALEKLRAGISTKFGVPLEAVDISVIDSGGSLKITSGLVFLSSADVARLGKSQNERGKDGI